MGESRQGILSYRSEKRRRRSPDLQQKRVRADCRDERRNARADITRLGVAKTFCIRSRADPRAAGPSKDVVSRMGMRANASSTRSCPRKALSSRKALGGSKRGATLPAYHFVRET